MVKKIFLMVALMGIMIAMPVQAQKIGAKIGYNFSKPLFKGDGADIFKNASGVLTAGTYGVYLNNGIAPFISIQLEGNYDPRGYTYDNPVFDIPGVSGSETDGDFYARMNYLTIPALIKVKVLMFHVEAGPYMSILLNAKEVLQGTVTYKDPITNQNTTLTLDEDNDIKSDLKGSDFGIAVGAGLTQNIGPIQFMGGLRYMMGITNIVKEPEGNDAIKHNVLTLYVGVAFGL